jgi:two-component system, OmpR family, response regulator AdeR
VNPQPNAQGRGQLVLVVEDEATLAETIELYLRHEGFRTERAADGERALELFRAARPDLVLLDLGLPKVDGMEVLRRIRAASDVPVVILTARAEEVDELLGLGMGADDYLVKPVSARKLLARVKVALRRSAPAAGDGPRGAARRRARGRRVPRRGAPCAGTPLELTPSEFKLVQHMARTPGRVIERAELYEAAIPDGDALERAVDIHVVNLRRKLREAGGGEHLIRTVRGRGYVLEDRAP